MNDVLSSRGKNTEVLERWHLGEMADGPTLEPSI